MVCDEIFSIKPLYNLLQKCFSQENLQCFNRVITHNIHYTRVHKYIHKCICTHMYTVTHNTYTNKYTYVYTQTDRQTYTNKHTHIHTHTRAHMYTHTKLYMHRQTDRCTLTTCQECCLIGASVPAPLRAMTAHSIAC